MAEWVLAGVLALTFSLWLVATVAFHFDRFRDPLGRWDALGLLPRWNFFAPNPGTHDFHLLIRDCVRPDVFTNWTRVEIGLASRSWVSALWYPGGREPKALYDIGMDALVTAATLEFDPGRMQFTPPYLALLNAAQAAPKTAFSKGRQFALALISPEGEDDRMLIRSALHRL